MLHDFDPDIGTTPFGTAYWYGAVYSLGFLGVFVWFWLRRKRVGLSDAEVFRLSILFAAGVMIGGRVFDIRVYELDYYRGNALAALNWWNGGMASHGVLLGGLLATILFARSCGLPVMVLLDEIVVPGVFLLAVGRIGNFIEGGVVGSVTTMPWGFIYPDLEGPRHPVALYEGAKYFLILPVLILSARRWEPGRGVTAGLFVLLYGALRFAVDRFRDYEAAWLGIGTGQVFNLIMAAAGLVMVIALLARPLRVPPRPAPRDRPGTWLQVMLLSALIVYPLGIPTSWTSPNIAAKRQEAMQDALAPGEAAPRP